MDKHISCTLCGGATRWFDAYRGRVYWKCMRCHSVLLDPSMHLCRKEEKQRYEEHNNDVNDKGYQKFVEPIVNEVKNKFALHHVGLDFGAGSGPVITKLLREAGYQVETYDPYFCDDKEKLAQVYDFIICCEVMEHFYSPRKEFALLRSLLKPGGSLVCMTELYHDALDFAKWYYKNDPTHVFFYHEQALAWIRNAYAFERVHSQGRMIHFEVSS